MKLIRFSCPECGDESPKDTWEEDENDYGDTKKYKCGKCGYIGELK
jgi:ribosomal protein S27AE